ncbi:MAG: long-chain fatty acid--CoA ligase [Chromatiales bacterium 21-64-14]|nr:MAG: long-chain fatty acid--CoA ligase [Chromatiales bacterium 21-64-14]HQU16333.1 long-chain fatty acid--CoA ligase [Gammaproteobacteria bacterium]
MSQASADFISPEQAPTVAAQFSERVRRSPTTVAYRQFDPQAQCWRDYTWAIMAGEVRRYQTALSREALNPGDRVAVMLPNCHEWVAFDQAALGSGLVLVPLYVDDRPENSAYILKDAGVRVLLTDGDAQWDRLRPVIQALPALQRVVTLGTVNSDDPRLVTLERWLPAEADVPGAANVEPGALATIVYTSGTTGRPKGVMLSHRNLVTNAYGSLQAVPAYPDDLFLSFLPLSHTFERTAGYYLPIMSGATVAFARSIPQLAEDLQDIRPTGLFSVPRIYERVYNRLHAQLSERPALARGLFAVTVAVGWARFLHRQGRAPWRFSFLVWPLLDRLVARKVRARLGGRLRNAICGGAPLSPAIARVFIGLGVEILQGYGLTESSPVISVNRADDNDPASVGSPLPGVDAQISESGELLTRGPNVMMGYWNNPEATGHMIDAAGWLHTGDKARIENGRIYITGRVKEIIVLANGEKVPPSDMELAIALDPLFDQVMVIGEGRPYLGLLAVLNQEAWIRLARKLELDPQAPDSLTDERLQEIVLQQVANRLASFPGYAQVRRAALALEPWTIERGLLTPTLKLRRARILDHHATQVEALYEGH